MEYTKAHQEFKKKSKWKYCE